MANKRGLKFGETINQMRGSLHVLDHMCWIALSDAWPPSLRRLVNEQRAQGQWPHPPPPSSKARASMVLQGRYMGYMRQLKLRQKAQVRKNREGGGLRRAIAKARGLVQSL